VIEGLAQALEGSGQPGLTELRELLQELFGGADATGRLIDQQRLKARIYRLRIAAGDRVHPLVVKRLDPGHAQRNRLAAARWLPAIGLDGCAPRLLGSAAERTGDSVWHVYEDLGDWRLDPKHPDPERVGAAIELIAQLHMRSAEHPLLPECRRCGGDLGMYFYASNVRDAICGLEALRPSAIELSPEQITLRDRLLERLYRLRGEQPRRARLMAELGGPDVLLHGDLWTTNTFVRPTGEGLQARLIDWDHVGVGPVSYDLSTFLYRFAAHDRPWILERYREGVARAGWRLPFAADLNVLFDTAECARYASRAVWPTVALLQDRAGWGFAELAEIEQWFAALKPALVP
jgi:hypothetical protein